MTNFAAFGVLALLLSLGACSGMRKDHDKQMQQEQQDSSMQSGMEDQSNTQSTQPTTTTP